MSSEPTFTWGRSIAGLIILAVFPSMVFAQGCGVSTWGSPFLVMPTPILYYVPSPIAGYFLTVPSVGSIPAPAGNPIRGSIRSGSAGSRPVRETSPSKPSVVIDSVVPAKSAVAAPEVIPPSSSSVVPGGKTEPPRNEATAPSSQPRPVNPLVIPLGPTEPPGSLANPPLPTAPSPQKVPAAAPTPADDPMKPNGIVIPPIVPKPMNREPTLPPLTLPTTPGGSTSFARPLPLEAKVTCQIFPVSTRTSAASTVKTVRFMNTSQHAVFLTVNGTTLALPAGHLVETQVVQRVRWSLNDHSEEDTVIPGGADGLEVVIRSGNPGR